MRAPSAAPGRGGPLVRAASGRTAGGGHARARVGEQGVKRAAAQVPPLVVYGSSRAQVGASARRAGVGVCVIMAGSVGGGLLTPARSAVRSHAPGVCNEWLVPLPVCSSCWWAARCEPLVGRSPPRTARLGACLPPRDRYGVVTARERQRRRQPAMQTGVDLGGMAGGVGVVAGAERGRRAAGAGHGVCVCVCVRVCVCVCVCVLRVRALMQMHTRFSLRMHREPNARGS